MLKGRESMFNPFNPFSQSNEFGNPDPRSPREQFEDEQKLVKERIAHEQTMTCDDPTCVPCTVARLGWMTVGGVIDADHEEDVIKAMCVAYIFTANIAASFSRSLVDAIAFFTESSAQRANRIQMANEADIAASNLANFVTMLREMRNERDNAIAPLSSEGILEGLQNFLNTERKDHGTGHGYGDEESRGD